MPLDKGTGSRRPVKKKTRPGPRDTRTVSTVMAEAKARQTQRDATVDAAPRSVFVPPALSAGGRPSPVHDNYAADKREKKKPKSTVDEVFKLALARPVQWNQRKQPDNVLGAVPQYLTPAQKRRRDDALREQRSTGITKLANKTMEAGARLATGVGTEVGGAARAFVGGVPALASENREERLRLAAQQRPQTAGVSGKLLLDTANLTGEVIGNIAEDTTNMAVGFAPGLVLGIANPEEFVKMGWEDLKYHLTPTDIGTKLREDAAWYIFSAWGAANVPGATAKVASRMRGGHQEVPLGYVQTEAGPVRRQVSDSTLTRHIQDRFANAGSAGPHGLRGKDNRTNLPLIGANKRAKKQLSMDNEKETARIMAPIAAFAALAGKAVRNRFKSVAYDRVAQFGGSDVEAIASITDEIAWRKEKGGIANRRLNLQLRGALRQLKKDDPYLRQVIDAGRALTEGAERIFIKYGMLTREAADARIALPTKAIYSLPDINSPVRDAYIRDLAALPEFRDDPDLLAAVVDVLDSSAYAWARRDSGEDPAHGTRTAEDVEARVAELEEFLAPMLEQVYKALRHDSPSATHTGKDRRPRRVDTPADKFRTHAIGQGDHVDASNLKPIAVVDGRAKDRGRAYQVISEQAIKSKDPILRRVTKAIEELDDLRALQQRNIDPEIVFGDQQAPGYNNVPSRSNPVNPADFYERVLEKPSFDGVDKDGAVLYQDGDADFVGRTYQENGDTWTVTEVGDSDWAEVFSQGVYSSVDLPWLRDKLRGEPAVGTQFSVKWDEDGPEVWTIERIGPRHEGGTHDAVLASSPEWASSQWFSLDDVRGYLRPSAEGPRRRFEAPVRGALFQVAGDAGPVYRITGKTEDGYTFTSIDRDYETELPHAEVESYFPSSIPSKASDPGVHKLEGFRSQLEDAIEEKMPTKASPEQVLGILKSAGIKEDEMAELKIREFLSGFGVEGQKQKSYTKEEVLAWIDSTKLVLEERVGDKLDGHTGADDNTQYSTYSTEGAKDPASHYREILIRLPENEHGQLFHHNHFPDRNVLVHLRTTERMVDGKKTVMIEEIQSDWHQAAQKQGYKQADPDNDPDVLRLVSEIEEATDAYKARRDELGLIYPDSHHGAINNLSDDVKSLKAIRLHVGAKYEAYQNPVGGGHRWEVRRTWTDELTGEERTATEGYYADEDAARSKAGELGKLSGILEDGNDITGSSSAAKLDEGIAQREELLAMVQRIGYQYEDLSRFRRMADSGVANAPFKKTWHELGFKRALAWAVENNFEQLSWTTGRSQSDFYNLAGHFDRIEIEEGRSGSPEEHLESAQEMWNQNADEARQRFMEDFEYREPRPDEDDFTVYGEDEDGLETEEFDRDAYEAAEEEWIEDSDEAADKAWYEHEEKEIEYLAERFEEEGSGGGGFTFHLTDRNGNHHEKDMEEGEELEQYIGPELAKRYYEDGQTVFEGQDMAVGDNAKSAIALSIFYDKKLVNFADKYLKKAGVKTERKKIGGKPLWELDYVLKDVGGRVVHAHDDKAQLESYLAHLREQPEVRDTDVYKIEERHRETQESHGPAAGVEVHTIAINDEVRKFVNAGQKLFQKGRRKFGSDELGSPRGATSRGKSGKLTVEHGETADASTPIHEWAHVIRLGVWESVPDAVKSTIETALGVRDGRWNRAQEEAFAKSIEAHIRTGKAPSPQLRQSYRTVSKRLKEVYKAGLGKNTSKLREDPAFVRAVASLINPTEGMQAGTGAFHVPHTAKRPALGGRMKGVTSKNRDRFYENTGYAWEQGKLRVGPKLTAEHATRAGRIQHQIDTQQRILRDFAQELPPGEDLTPGWVPMNPNGVKMPRHLKEMDEGKEFMERLEGIGPEDLDEMMQQEIRDIQALAFPDELQTVAARQAGQELFQIPQWVKDAYVEELAFTVPVGSVLKTIGAAIDFTNNVARLGLIYLSPAYIPVNFAANEILAIVQQGVFHPFNMARALGIMGDLQKDTIRMLDLEQSGSGARALAGEGRGRVAAVTQGVAEFMNTGADVLPRRTAILHELWKYGYRSDAKIRALLEDPSQRDKLNQISQGSNEAMVRFDGLSPEEKKVISKGIFIYRWMKGATRYAVRLPLDHPVATPLMAEIGAFGYEELEKKRGEVIASFFRGQLPLGDKYKDALGTTLMKVVNFNSVSPVTTGLDAFEAIYGSLSGKGVTRLGDMFSPPIDVGIQLATGEDNFGNAHKGNPLQSILTREAKAMKPVRLATGMISPPKETRFYGAESRGDIATRAFTGIWPPRPLKIEEAIAKGYEEMPTVERYLKKMRAGDKEHTPAKVTKKLITREAKKQEPYDEKKRKLWANLTGYLVTASEEEGSFEGLNASLAEYEMPPISRDEYEEMSEFARQTRETVGG